MTLRTLTGAGFLLAAFPRLLSPFCLSPYACTPPCVTQHFRVMIDDLFENKARYG